MAAEISKISLKSDTVEAKMGYVMSSQKEAKHWNESVSYALECEVTCEKNLERGFVREWLSSRAEHWVPEHFFLRSVLESGEASLHRAKNHEVKINEAFETIKVGQDKSEKIKAVDELVTVRLREFRQKLQ